MREHIKHITRYDKAKTVDKQMIMNYPILKGQSLIQRIIDDNPLLSMYTPEAAEDNARCFLKINILLKALRQKFTLMSLRRTAIFVPRG